ncbi:MAG: hypothetical protein WD027_08180 [Gaiellales bacterium]
MPLMRCRLLILTLAPLLVLAAACGGEDGSGTQGGTVANTAPGPAGPGALPQGSERVELDPADFVASIDNPYWPMAPGSKWVYSETDAKGNEQRVEVTVTDRAKKILGIDATVVHDVVSENGQLIEDTYDWYGQDTAGNIWYLGEDTKEYEDGKVVSTEGSWEAGVDGAQAGILLPAAPKVGMTYRQEYYAGEAEDNGEILSLEERVEGPFGSFEHVLMTKDTTPLEPKILEHKFYAKGVGLVLAISISGGGGLEQLIRFKKAP